MSIESTTDRRASLLSSDLFRARARTIRSTTYARIPQAKAQVTPTESEPSHLMVRGLGE
jgi:hypothetical protein